jgi:5-methyltetrahydrofolate--homocysteine methyltransferase
LYFSHPEARYFTVGRIGADQVADYARRKEMALEDVERWLTPNLGYDPGGSNAPRGSAEELPVGRSS